MKPCGLACLVGLLLSPPALAEPFLQSDASLEPFCVAGAPSQACGRVHRGVDGVVDQMVGPFGHGGSAAGLPQFVRSLIAATADLSALPGGYSLVEVGGGFVTDNTATIRLQQAIAGVPVLGGELVAVFIDDQLYAVNGRALGAVVAPDLVPAVASLELAVLLDAVATHFDDEVLDAMVTQEGPGSHPQEVTLELAFEGDVRAKLFWEPGEMALVWRVSNTEETVLVDAEFGDVLRVDSNYLNQSGNGVANVRHRLPSLSNPQNWTSATAIGQEYTYYTERRGQRVYILGYRGTDFPVDGTYDGLGPEVSETVRAGTIPSFDSMSNNLLEQQTIYFYVKLARDHYEWNADVSPFYTSAISGIFMNNPSYYCGTAPACYNTSTDAIYFDDLGTGANGAQSIGTMWHEYGHAIVDMHGNLNLGCSDGVDESRPLNESIAEAFSMLLGNEYLGQTYHSDWQIIGRNDIIRDEHNQYGKNVEGDFSCPTHSLYWIGVPFEQAFWEVLNNMDCEGGSNCHTSGPGYGGEIGWVSPAQARDALLNSMLYALNVLPGSTTYDAFVNWMLVYIQYQYGSTKAANVSNVFKHHGYY